MYYLSRVNAVAGQKACLYPVPAEEFWSLAAGFRKQRWDSFKSEKVSGLTVSQQGAEPGTMGVS